MHRFLATSAALAVLGSAAAAQNTNGALPVRFFDLAPQAGVDTPCFGRGSAIVDLDGDGLLDLVATSSSVQTYYFRQLPGGGPPAVPQFTEMTSAWRMPQDTKQSWGTVAADFDNDGDQDLYFPCGAFHYAETNRLLRNDLDTLGTFTRMDAAAAGAAVTLLDPSFGASAVDFDRDGDLDIFTSATYTFGSTQGQPLRLLRNDGNLHFTDVSAAAGLTHLGNYKHTGVGDVDNDGWLDLGVGQMGGPARLYRNNRDGTFREIAQAAGLAGPTKNFGFVFDDFDNDGWQDVFLPQYLHVCCTGISRLYLNNRDGTFRDVSNASNIGRHEDMGHNVGDLNADGFPDIYIGAGHPNTQSFDVLYMVRPNGGSGLRVLDLSAQSRISTAGAGRNHGTPLGDVNDDGYVDIWAVNGGPATQPNTIQASYLWMSEGNQNRWLKADLRGVISNRDAVGARMSVRTQDGRDVHRTITAGRGFTNTDAHVTHFGLGQTARAAWLRVVWPSGLEQYHLDPPLGRTTPVVETVITSQDVARLGQTVAVEATGPVGYEVRAMAARQPAFELRPDLGGFLRLGGQILELPPVTLGPTGRVQVAVPVPADVTALGRTLYVQARVSRPGSSEGILTNGLEFVIQ